jgi:hypothetical protein
LLLTLILLLFGCVVTQLSLKLIASKFFFLSSCLQLLTRFAVASRQALIKRSAALYFQIFRLLQLLRMVYVSTILGATPPTGGVLVCVERNAYEFDRRN